MFAMFVVEGKKRGRLEGGWSEVKGGRMEEGEGWRLEVGGGRDRAHGREGGSFVDGGRAGKSGKRAGLGKTPKEKGDYNAALEV